MVTATKQKLTPPELAKQWGISEEKVVGWILAGELRAIDGSARRGQRPRYLIDVADIEAFEASREVSPPPAKPKRRPKPAEPVGFVRHFRSEGDQ